jgi:hypothetical protein
MTLLASAAEGGFCPRKEIYETSPSKQLLMITEPFPMQNADVRWRREKSFSFIAPPAGQ